MNTFGLIVNAAALADSGLSIGSLIAGRISTLRECSVELENNTSNYTLSKPRVYYDKGCCINPFPPTIKPSAVGNATFSKNPNTPQGSIGVFTFDLHNNSIETTTEKAAVLFVVPFDLNLKPIVYGVGIFGDVACNKDLFKKMYKTRSTDFVRGKADGSSLTHEGQNFTITATMSKSHRSIMRVQIAEK